MSATTSALSGFIELTVRPDQQQLQSITTNNYPLSISFAPRSTPPLLQGNTIIESTDNSTNDCTYLGNKYKLINIQICSVMNKGFRLPGQTTLPSAELILTFSPTSSASIKQLDAILMCIPIYESNTPNHNEYLTQLIDSTMPQCKYTQKEGVSYSPVTEFTSIPNSNLMNCVKACCDNANCISYTFNSGKCSLNNAVSNLTTSDTSVTSGTIIRGGNGENTVPHSTLTPSLETIFYNSPVDTSQTSLAYMTTFNTVNSSNTVNSTNNLYIVIFPNGIRMTSGTYQQLLLQMRSMNSSITSALLPYYVPSVIRNNKNTLLTYEFDSSGNKIPKGINGVSDKGQITQTTLSSCNDQFKNRVQYFTKPPFLLSKSSKSFNSEKCPYYKTTDYKCVPFNQLHDLSGVNQDAYVIPGNSTLQNIIDKNKSTSNSSVSVSMATDDIIVYSTVAICGIVLAVVIYKLGEKIKEIA